MKGTPVTMFPTWSLLQTPPGPATALRVECRHEPRTHGRYLLAAFDGKNWVHSRFYDWNVWLGHGCGQLLMPAFTAAAEKAADQLRIQMATS